MTLKTTIKNALTRVWNIIFPPQIRKTHVVTSNNIHLRLLYVIYNKDTREPIGIFLVLISDISQISETSSQIEISEVFKIAAVPLFILLFLRRYQILSLFKSAVSNIISAVSKIGNKSSKQLQVILDLQNVKDVEDKVKKELKKMKIIEVTTTSPNDVLPIIVVRYHGFRIDSDVAESLQIYGMEEIERMILIILHRHEERADNLHGKVEDPKMIPFSETETPRYRDYQKLKGIIHTDVGPEKKDIFKNCGQKIKAWLNEIQNESKSKY